MCGIVGLHLRDDSLQPDLGALLTDMLATMCSRGPDSAGVAVYGDPRWSPDGHETVSMVLSGADPVEVAGRVELAAGLPVFGMVVGQTIVLRAAADGERLARATREAVPEGTVVGFGPTVTVLKGVGDPRVLADEFGLARASGWQGVGHTRMATESAVTVTGSHPFSVGPDQCLVHNGSFSNYDTIRTELRREGIEFDTENDTEVAARFVAKQLAEGADLEKSLRLLAERFDGFYTLLVSTRDSFAVIRDPIACKPAVIAESDGWVAMASEYQSLAGLPGIGSARIYEPTPGRLYLWAR